MYLQTTLLKSAKKFSQYAKSSHIDVKNYSHSSLSHIIKLCLVTNRLQRPFEWLIDVVEKSVEGGITMVQLRENDIVPDNEMITLAELLMEKLKPLSIPLIINDRVDICKIVGAQGVHLGQTDMHPDQARDILGENVIIGLSLESMEQAKAANMLSSINYVAASPVFHSNTKSDYNSLWGIGRLKLLTSYSKHPVMSIGGINVDNIEQIMKAGSKGVAVVSAILEAEYPDQAANALLKILNKNLDQVKSSDRCR